MKKGHLVAVLAGFLSACGGEYEADLEVVSSESHSWGNYHWARTSNPFTLKVGDNVSSQWDGILDTSIGDWSQSQVLNLQEVVGQAKGKNCRPTAGRVEVCNSTYGNNGWLGIAQIWASGSHITQGVVKVNDTYYNTPTYNTTAWRNLVMCQEIGHTFGLGHQDEDFDNANLGTCMDYTSNPGTNQHPNNHDYQMLETIYAHLDSTTTVGGAAPGPGKGQNDDDFGEPTDDEHIYVKDLGHGNAVFTIVYWAE